MDQQIKQVAEKMLGSSIPEPNILTMSQDGMKLVGTFASGGMTFDFVLEPEGKYPIQYKPRLQGEIASD